MRLIGKKNTYVTIGEILFTFQFVQFVLTAYYIAGKRGVIQWTISSEN